MFTSTLLLAVFFLAFFLEEVAAGLRPWILSGLLELFETIPLRLLFCGSFAFFHAQFPEAGLYFLLAEPVHYNSLHTSTGSLFRFQIDEV